MEANELMIGDWVKFTSKYGHGTGQVVGIEPMEGSAEPTTFTIWKKDKEGDTKFFVGVSKNSVEPLPLTPEILEKNGFKYVKGNQWIWEKKYYSNVDIMYIDDCISFCKEYPSEKNGGLQTGGWIQAMSERGRVDIASEYVHDLQHALRLCKIDKEITI